MKCNHTVGIVKDYENNEYPWNFIYESDKQNFDDMCKFNFCPNCGEKLR